MAAAGAKIANNKRLRKSIAVTVRRFTTVIMTKRLAARRDAASSAMAAVLFTSPPRIALQYNPRVL